MAKEPTRTELDTLLKEQVMGQVTELLENQGLTPARIASNKLVFEMPDATGDDRYVRIDIVTPKGSRDGTPYNADELIADYELKQEIAIAKKAEREKKSLAKQEERKLKEAERDLKATTK